MCGEPGESKMVIPTFKVHVDGFQVWDSLANVLRHIHRNDYSQFLVYDDSNFVG